MYVTNKNIVYCTLCPYLRYFSIAINFFLYFKISSITTGKPGTHLALSHDNYSLFFATFLFLLCITIICMIIYIVYYVTSGAPKKVGLPC